MSFAPQLLMLGPSVSGCTPSRSEEPGFRGLGLVADFDMSKACQAEMPPG